MLFKKSIQLNLIQSKHCILFDFYFMLLHTITFTCLAIRQFLDTSKYKFNKSLYICLANPVNWSPNPDNPEPSGFIPFGVLSIFKGAAMFSFAFIAVESLIRPKSMANRSVSYTGLLSFAMVLVSMMGSAIVLTLMWPHNLMVCMAIDKINHLIGNHICNSIYLLFYPPPQHNNIPFPHAFSDYDYQVAKWIVSIAAIVILSTR